QEDSTLGFECTLEEVDLEDITKNQINTIKACTPEDPGVKNTQIYQQSAPYFHGTDCQCRQGIYEDLSTYRAELRNFRDQKVLATIDEMIKVSIS
ncbi:IL12A protein, partial [Bucorvus abyssinicus]|nr:IL12A protein [Bucorvus abyssinicus]